MSGRDDLRAELGSDVRPTEAGIRLVAKNGMLAAAQVVLTSLGFLLAYRVMSLSLGIEVIGSWGLCLAIGSIATLADLGATDGMARTVAQRAVEPDSVGLRRVLLTGLLFCAAGCLIGAVICYGIARTLLPKLLPDPTALTTTLALLAPALLVASLNAIGLSCQAVLEGLERYTFRFLAGVAGTLVFVTAILLLVPEIGLHGVVWAYSAQAVVLLGISGTLCWRLTRPTVPDASGHGPSRILLRELIRIGLPVRATGLMTVLLDPLTRVAVTYFGGTASAGHYEVASRLALQIRTVVVAGFQAGLPRLVKLAAVGSDDASRVTGQTYRAGLSIAVAAFTLAVLLGPLVYEFVLGDVPPIGMRFFVMLCVGWCVNSVSAPFFFNLLAKRRVAALWLSSGVMAVVNVVLFSLLGRLFGDQGVVAALAIAIAAGSVVTIVAARRSDIAIPRWVHGSELLLLAASLVAFAAFVSPSLRAGGASAAVVPLMLATLGYATVVVIALHLSGIFRR